MTEKEIYDLLWKHLGYLEEMLKPDDVTCFDGVLDLVSEQLALKFTALQTPENNLKEKTGA